MEIAESEIYKSVFDLVQSIADQPDLETVCNALASSLCRVISFDFLGLPLHDPTSNQLRLSDAELFANIGSFGKIECKRGNVICN